MLYSVSQIATTINVSRQSIYNKLKLKELKGHISKNKGVTYVDEVGFNLIKDSLKLHIEGINDLNNKETANTLNEYIEPQEESLNIYKAMLELLKDQLLEKDKQMQTKDIQIEDLNNRLAAEQDLHKNTQILFKQQQPQDIKLLEEHFQDLDAKLEEVKTNMQQRKEEQQQKGFFSKMFKK